MAELLVEYFYAETKHNTVIVSSLLTIDIEILSLVFFHTVSCIGIFVCKLNDFKLKTLSSGLSKL